MPKYDLSGQVAIVTGGGQGMGRAISLRLAREGAAATVADINLETATGVVQEIEAQGGQALAVKADVTKREDADRMVQETVARFGRLDILVNNAGLLVVTPVLDMDDDAWDSQMDVNARGVLYCSQAAARRMIDQGEGGRIITIGSSAGKIPAGQDVPIAGYVASKHAAVGLTKQMALEVARHNILVNLVFPGIVDTDMLALVQIGVAAYQGVPLEEFQEQQRRSIPLGEFQAPETVANMVAFLCSTDADYSTASIFNVTGGAFPYY